VHDVCDAVAAVLDRWPLTDGIAIIGSSAGAAHACSLATYTDDVTGAPADRRIRSVVSASGPTWFPTIFTDCQAWTGSVPRTMTAAMQNYLGLTETTIGTAQIAKDASPVSWVDALDVPVLAVHGTGDFIAPAQGQRLTDALTAKGVPDCRTVTRPERGHASGLLRYMLPEVESFLRSHFV
jgi:pimeloyl-ACP methyl ester carboxylesterase